MKRALFLFGNLQTGVALWALGGGWAVCAYAGILTMLLAVLLQWRPGR
jgi:hypothetical protein